MGFILYCIEKTDLCAYIGRLDHLNAAKKRCNCAIMQVNSGKANTSRCKRT